MTKKRRLAIISDFHLDSNHFSIEEIELFISLLNDLQITDLHFAGDISNDLHNISELFFHQLESLTDLSVISLTVVSFNLSCNIPILFFTFERFTFIVIFLTTGKPHQNLSKAIFQINF